MSSEAMNQVYAETAMKAFDDCMEVMVKTMPAFKNNTAEFINANVYVAGGMLAACQIFAPTRQEKEEIKKLILTAVLAILDNNIEMNSPPEGPGN
jgi:hypothetical protein